jgi:hypothetical protein
MQGKQIRVLVRQAVGMDRIKTAATVLLLVSSTRMALAFEDN